MFLFLPCFTYYFLTVITEVFFFPFFCLALPTWFAVLTEAFFSPLYLFKAFSTLLLFLLTTLLAQDLTLLKIKSKYLTTWIFSLLGFLASLLTSLTSFYRSCLGPSPLLCRWTTIEKNLNIHHHVVYHFYLHGMSVVSPHTYTHTLKEKNENHFCLHGMSAVSPRAHTHIH